jgi:hypothetical protein
MSEDPKRWLEDDGAAPPGARELLAQARKTKGPDKRAVALSAAALLELGAQPSSAAAAVLAKLAGTPAALASLPLAGKLAIAATTVALAVAGVQVAQRSAPAPASAPSAMRAAKTAVARSTRAAVAPAPAAQPLPTLAQPEPPALEAVPLPAAAPAARPPTTPRRARVPIAKAPAPEPAAVAAAAASSEEPVDELALEVRWLDQARGLLASDPPAALARADAHAQRFASGALAAERELIAVDALQRLGRVPEARKRADALLARNPGSLYRGRLQRVLRRSR